MKKLQILWASIVFILGLIFILHAQEAEMTAIHVGPLSLKVTDLPTLKTLSDAELETFLNALDATPTIPAEALPRSATLWSLANPTWPPFPGNVNHLSAWTIDEGNAYLLNDVGFDYQAQARPKMTMRMMSMGVPGFDDIDDSGTNIYESGYAARVYTTNELWLSITGKTQHNGLSSNPSAVECDQRRL